MANQAQGAPAPAVFKESFQACVAAIGNALWFCLRDVCITTHFAVLAKQTISQEKQNLNRLNLFRGADHE